MKNTFKYSLSWLWEERMVFGFLCLVSPWKQQQREPVQCYIAALELRSTPRWSSENFFWWWSCYSVPIPQRIDSETHIFACFNGRRRPRGRIQPCCWHEHFHQKKRIYHVKSESFLFTKNLLLSTNLTHTTLATIETHLLQNPALKSLETEGNHGKWKSLIF